MKTNCHKSYFTKKLLYKHKDMYRRECKNVVDRIGYKKGKLALKEGSFRLLSDYTHTARNPFFGQANLCYYHDKGLTVES